MKIFYLAFYGYDVNLYAIKCKDSVQTSQNYLSTDTEKLMYDFYRERRKGIQIIKLKHQYIVKKVYLFLFLTITLGLNAQSVEMLSIKCDTTATKIDLSTYMDTYYEENYVNPDKEMTKAFDPVFLVIGVIE